MAAPVEDPEEAPLDPAVERVQQRLRRLMLISTGTLGLGFLAVIVAIIFRVSNLGGSAPATGEAWNSTLELPVGAVVVATDLDGDRLAVTVDAADGRSIHVFHLPSGQRLGTSRMIAR